MSRYRRAYTEGATYFFTVVAFGRRPILCDAPLREALRGAIREVKSRRPFVIDAWVLLPDHLHCMWTLPNEDADFSTRWALIKREVSLTCPMYRDERLLTAARIARRESSVWQRRFWEHRIRDEEDFARHADYIHFNPVKHGLSRAPSEWPYSSFHRFVETGIYPADWSGGLEAGGGDFGE